MSALVIAIPYSDDELIMMIQNKNQNAFAYLYDKYSAALYGTICKEVSDKKRCEEILEQTFLIVWKSLTNNVNLNRRLFVWMMNVARNLTANAGANANNYNPDFKSAAV